jgi:hypothetical protein
LNPDERRAINPHALTGAGLVAASACHIASAAALNRYRWLSSPPLSSLVLKKRNEFESQLAGLLGQPIIFIWERDAQAAYQHDPIARLREPLEGRPHRLLRVGARRQMFWPRA